MFPKRLLFFLIILLFFKRTTAQQDDSVFNATTAVSPDSNKVKLDSVHSVADSIPFPDIIETPAEKTFDIGGVVLDKNTGEGIPFATIFFPKSEVGTSADLDGNFSIKTAALPSDTLRIEAIGYESTYKILTDAKKSYGFYIELSRSDNLLREFVLRPGEDPAIELVKNIIRKKADNNPDRTENYRYEVYNKLEVDLERLSKSQFEKLPIPYMKRFSFIYDNLDTSAEGKPFLPFYFTETLSDYYFQREPKRQREFIKAAQVKGVNNESVTKFLGSMYQNVNAYDNFISVFDKKFVSPISNQGLFYYKYKIKDTQTAYGYNIILVQFSPKRSGENCFFGDFWVADSAFALQRISMEVPKLANINWVDGVSVYQEFAPMHDSTWFPVKDKFIAHFTATYGAKLPGFIGRKTTSYKNILVNDPSVTEVINEKKYKQDVIVADTAGHHDDAFWSNVRHDSLSKNEKAIYKMIDTLEKLPIFTTYKNMIRFFASGVKDVGCFEIGPYWYIYSNNIVEGPRFRLSLGTNPRFLKDVYVNGYVAYGVRDERFKYKAAALWLLDRKPRMYLYGSYTHDIDRTTNYYDEVSTDNIFSVAVRKKNIPWKLAFVDEYRFEFFKEYYSGFSHQLSLITKEFDPYAPLPSTGVFTDLNGNPAEQIHNTELNLRLRFAHKEKFVEGNYYRFSLGSDYPIIEARLGLGLKNVLKGGYNYQKASLSISDYISIPPAGVLYANIFGGKYFGVLPYPLLEIHPGNEFYYYNKYAFNMMNRYEFISDQYVGINLEHNIGGGIFNYIPLLKKLKMRQFWTAKALYGDLSDANKALNLDKGYPFRTLNEQPYVELGTGVSNILQVFRLDFVWRVSPKSPPGEALSRRFGIFGSVRFNF
ncbi:MAG TPA: DUF5686 family protein [Flavipsychrobacter sp.]|nr:DUF5686 family protein [Flavipsychrobacter sp.]